MADFEDANTPSWENMVQGQINLTDAIERRIDFTSPEGKDYALNDDRRDAHAAPARVAPAGEARPRRRAADERVAVRLRDVLLPQRPARLLDKGTRPYFYLPKMESHLEARLWNDVFNHAQDALGVPRGTIRATVLIETIPAAFEMDEILYELRDHSSGLNAGRWDYMFSMIKTFRDRGADFVLPDRNAVTMTVPFMRAYTELLVQTCHKRERVRDGRHGGVHPEPQGPGGQRAALDEGRRRQAARGRRRLRRHLGGAPRPGPDRRWRSSTRSWATGPNQIDKKRPEVQVTRRRPARRRGHARGRSPSGGLRTNIDVGIRYIAVLAAPATARRRSTTSWRTPRPPRSAAARCGSGCTTTSRSPTPASR